MSSDTFSPCDSEGWRLEMDETDDAVAPVEQVTVLCLNYLEIL